MIFAIAGHDHGRGQDLPSSEGCEGPSITEEMLLSPRSSYNEKSCVAQLCETFKRFAGRASIRRSLSYTLD